jgi:hypothetical protein
MSTISLLVCIYIYIYIYIRVCVLPRRSKKMSRVDRKYSSSHPVAFVLLSSSVRVKMTVTSLLH